MPKADDRVRKADEMKKAINDGWYDAPLIGAGSGGCTTDEGWDG